MKGEAISGKQQRLLLYSAILAPLLHAASGCSWLTVLAVGGCSLVIWLGLNTLLENWEKPAWVSQIQWLWITVVYSQVLLWVMSCWRYAGGLWVPMVLLLLSAWTGIKGQNIVLRSAAVLRLFMFAVTGLVLISGIREIHWENAVPVWQMKDGKLIVVLLIPALLKQEKGYCLKSGLGILLTAFVISFITIGVLSGQCAWDADSPFYELSRSMTLFGVTKRFESVTAVAMTIGYFILGGFLLDRAGAGMKSKEKAIIISSGISAIVLIARVVIDARLLSAGCFLFWVFIPALACAANKMKKFEKTP